MRIIGICNLKGGVGKTTTAFSLAAALAEMGHSVLTIDADPQGSLTECFGIRQAGATLADVLRGQATVGTAAQRTSISGVWLLPASPALQELNRKNLAGERVLLARLPDICDFALIDCPAGVGVVLLNALNAAGEILSPVQARGMAPGGILRLLKLIHELRERRTNPCLDLTAVLVNQFDTRTRICHQVVHRMRADYGEIVLQTLVHDSARLAESTDSGLPIGQYAPTCRAATEIRSMARELVQRVPMRQGYFARRARRREPGSIATAGGRPVLATVRRR